MSSLNHQSYSQRDLADFIVCSASSVSRELVRNAQGKTYDSQRIQRACLYRRISSSPQVKLHAESILFDVLHTKEQVDIIADDINNQPRNWLTELAP
jgi:IS30 family transposase